MFLENAPRMLSLGSLGSRYNYREEQEEQRHALRLVSGATMHLPSVALCVTRVSVHDAAGCALTIRRAAQGAEDRT
jgi:hypothetical protein